ncbi:MAG: hypothetical protein KDE27_30560, partial [Planctomycetes bacterium]|nr:hypothetical protein [Planctomycetota bacterium]
MGRHPLCFRFRSVLALGRARAGRLARLAALGVAIGSLVAQCDPYWLPGAGVPGVGGPVNAVATLSNGDIIAGGVFAIAGDAACDNIARWNGSSWSALGTGVTGGGPGAFAAQVAALVTLPNGDLVVGGEFTFAGGVACRHIARWNGSAWTPLGAGMLGTTGAVALAPTVTALAVMPNGDVVAGGRFTFAGGVAASGIARWNGSSWAPLGAGMTSPFAVVRALTTLPNGDLVAAGSFTTAGGIACNHIARWDGVAWSALGVGVDDAVEAVVTLANGDVVAGGAFLTAGGLPCRSIARWDGSTWSPLGSGITGIAGPDQPGVRALTTLPGGALVAGGRFDLAGGVPCSGIASWSGSTWSALGGGVDGAVSSLAPSSTGGLFVGGEFLTAGGAVSNHIARWNGVAWAAMGTGTFGWLRALATLPNGDLVAGGALASVGGVPC